MASIAMSSSVVLRTNARIVGLFELALVAQEAVGAPAALAHDQLVAAVTDRADGDRLLEAAGVDRGGELAQRLLVEVLPGLVGIGLDLVEGDALQAHAGAPVLG